MPPIIQVTAYDPSWPHRYRQEARQIVNALTSQVILLHHIGSTAIPGIKSKSTYPMYMFFKQVTNKSTAIWISEIICVPIQNKLKHTAN